jgi:hypothetical protein
MPPHISEAFPTEKRSVASVWNRSLRAAPLNSRDAIQVVGVVIAPVGAPKSRN